jgi:hypothetical protein
LLSCLYTNREGHPPKPQREHRCPVKHTPHWRSGSIPRWGIAHYRALYTLFFEDKDMTFQTLKDTVLQHVTADWVRDNFGDLRRRETWEAAYDRCSEFIATAADAAKPVVAKVVEIVTSDKAQDFYRGVLIAVALVMAVVVIGLSRAARHYWSVWVRPVALIVYAYGRDKAVMGWRVFRRWMEAEFENAVSLAMFAWQGI